MNAHSFPKESGCLYPTACLSVILLLCFTECNSASPRICIKLEASLFYIMDTVQYLLGKELPLTRWPEGRVSWPPAADWKLESCHKNNFLF